jgi:hypothetical protein
MNKASTCAHPITITHAATAAASGNKASPPTFKQTNPHDF